MPPPAAKPPPNRPHLLSWAAPRPPRAAFLPAPPSLNRCTPWTPWPLSSTARSRRQSRSLAPSRPPAATSPCCAPAAARWTWRRRRLWRRRTRTSPAPRAALAAAPAHAHSAAASSKTEERAPSPRPASRSSPARPLSHSAGSASQRPPLPPGLAAALADLAALPHPADPMNSLAVVQAAVGHSPGCLEVRWQRVWAHGPWARRHKHRPSTSHSPTPASSPPPTHPTHPTHTHTTAVHAGANPVARHALPPPRHEPCRPADAR